MYQGKRIIAHKSISKSFCIVVLLFFNFFPSSLVIAQIPPLQKQSSIVYGTVVDSISKLPLASVSVTFYIDEEPDAVLTVTSEEDGSFQISIPHISIYKLLVSSVGYAAKQLMFNASEFNNDSIKKIFLTPITGHLQEVRVTASKPLIKYEEDRIVYNVEGDPESAALSTFEMLRKVPMVTIDGSENIEVNGDGNFLVLLNNRPSSLFVRNIGDVFKSLPASSVKRIEVITNPPARYESEGVAGIINIITHRKNVTGYTGSVRAGYATPGGPSTGGSITAKVGDLGLSGIWGYNKNENPTTSTTHYRLDKLNNTIMNQVGQSSSYNSNLNGGLELSWQLNEKNLLNVHYNRTINKGQSLSEQQVDMTGATGSLLRSFNNNNRNDRSSNGQDIGFDYQRSFKKNSQQILTFSIKELNNRGNNISNMLMEPKLGSTMSKNRSGNDNSFRERTAQIDYVHPFKKHVFELGVKAILRYNTSDSHFERWDATTGTFIWDSRQGNNFDNTQDIYAAYASLSLKIKSITLRTGARWEQTDIAANFHNTGTEAQQLYQNFLPNVSLFKKLGKTTSMNVGYSQRMQRPSLYYINPFVDDRDPYNLSFGNPALKPTVTHIFNLSLNTYAKGTSFTLNLFHNYTDGSILQYTTLGKDTISRTTFGNIGNDQSSGITLSTSFKIFKKLNLSINTSGQYQQFTSMINNKLQTNDGMSYNVSGNAGYNFNGGWRTGFNAGYHSSRISFQGRNAGYFHNNWTLSKTFLKDKKANFNLSIANPFQEHRRNITELDDNQFYMIRESQVVIRRFNFTVNYRFGKLLGGLKRNKRGIENDDLKTE